MLASKIRYTRQKAITAPVSREEIVEAQRLSSAFVPHKEPAPKPTLQQDLVEPSAGPVVKSNLLVVSDLSAFGPGVDVSESGPWHYRYGRMGEKTSEPLTLEKLAELAKYAVITKLTPVKKEGWSEYREALDVPELLAAFEEAACVSRPVKHIVAVLLGITGAIMTFAAGCYVSCHWDETGPQLVKGVLDGIPVWLIGGVMVWWFITAVFVYPFRLGTQKEVRWVSFSIFFLLMAVWFACVLPGDSTSPFQFSDVATITTDSVNVRAASKPTAEVLLQLSQGDQVELLEPLPAPAAAAEAPTFVKIRMPAACLVWVAQTMLDANISVVVRSGSNLRAGPGTICRRDIHSDRFLNCFSRRSRPTTWLANFDATNCCPTKRCMTRGFWPRPRCSAAAFCFPTTVICVR